MEEKYDLDDYLEGVDNRCMLLRVHVASVIWHFSIDISHIWIPGDDHADKGVSNDVDDG